MVLLTWSYESQKSKYRPTPTNLSGFLEITERHLAVGISVALVADYDERRDLLLRQVRLVLRSLQLPDLLDESFYLVEAIPIVDAVDEDEQITWHRQHEQITWHRQHEQITWHRQHEQITWHPQHEQITWHRQHATDRLASTTASI